MREGDAALRRDEQPRGWVVRLGAYLRIFGAARSDAGQPEHRHYIDSLAAMAKKAEVEHGR